MDKKNVIIALLILNLIVMIYFGNSIGKKISNDQTHTIASINSIQNTMLSMEHRIINGISDELKAQTNKIAQVDYKLLSVDPAEKKAQLELMVTLKEVSPASEISISYHAQDDSQPKEAVLVEQSGLIYGTVLEMSLDHNYRFDVWEKSAAAGQKQLNADEQRLSLYDDFYASRVTVGGSGTATSEDRMDVDFSFAINDLGIAGTELEQILIQIWKGNEQYDEVDVTEQAEQRMGNYAHIEDKYKLALASGQIDQSVSLEQFAIDNGLEPEPGKPDANLHYTLKHSIVFSEDYPELKLDMGMAKQLSFRLILKFKDGYVYSQ